MSEVITYQVVNLPDASGGMIQLESIATYIMGIPGEVFAKVAF